MHQQLGRPVGVDQRFLQCIDHVMRCVSGSSGSSSGSGGRAAWTNGWWQQWLRQRTAGLLSHKIGKGDPAHLDVQAKVDCGLCRREGYDEGVALSL